MTIILGSVSNQMKIKSIYLSLVTWGVVARSPEPKAHVSNVRAFRIELEFRKVVFLGKGKTGAPGEKTLGAEKRTNNKLDLHDSAPNLEIEPWVTLVGEASVLTTTPSLLPQGAIPQGYVQLHALLSVGQLFFDYPMALLTM